ncbi:hypothetical protein PROFUN_01805 [Planoprotostelium fungivorum]|uniref:FAD-binding domain-containing protein n=1 Tax=Planoprotostelium fungivorum TaxID=1890364 RepID=A0A2P6NYQ5_9EUKA|nr:hypothetical protein PROFUN_01805 [Planoprotostelium fungivorum]
MEGGSLRVIVIGAGLSGLSTALALSKKGCNVTVFERAKELKEVGAGVQVSVNMLRILDSWGLAHHISTDGVILRKIVVRRWEDDRVLGEQMIMPWMQDRYNYPSYVIHRADLFRILFKACEEQGVRFKTNARVDRVDFEATRVEMEDGSTHEADLIVGADGIRSIVRQQMQEIHREEHQLRKTGDSVYRAIIDIESVPSEQLRGLMREPIGTRWLGESRHIMAYPIRAGRLYNLVFIHPTKDTPDDAGSDVPLWTTKGSLSDLREEFRGWSSTVSQLIDCIPRDVLTVWNLCDSAPLSRWIHGSVALVGDSCHPTLPYVAQGAAQAIEDAAVLGECIDLYRGDPIRNILKVFQVARKNRAERMTVRSARCREGDVSTQASAQATRTALHHADGPEQEERDKQMRAAMEGQKTSHSDHWMDMKKQDEMYGFDVVKDVRERRDELKASVEE